MVATPPDRATRAKHSGDALRQCTRAEGRPLCWRREHGPVESEESAWARWEAVIREVVVGGFI